MSIVHDLSRMSIGLPDRAVLPSGKPCAAPVGKIAEDAEKKTSMDEAAFRALYDRTARPLWAYLLRISGDRDVVDDLLQESYCRFLSAQLPQMNHAESKSYLFRIATNLMNDRWRQRKLITTLDEVEQVTEEHLEARAQMRQAFLLLKPRERQLLWLAYVEGSSHREIAGMTGLRATSIRLLLFRARRRLAGVLRVCARPSKEKLSV